MRLVTRAEWGARAPKSRITAQLTGPSTGHWNGPLVSVGGNPNFDHLKCASLVRGIQNFHMDSRGWTDIAYNFIVCPHGYTFVCRGLNVINGANGTNSANRSSHAIMWLAGQGNAFPEIEKQEFRECVKYIDDNTNASFSVVGHRDWKSTECPGDERHAWIHQGMPVTSIPTTPNKDDEMYISILIHLYERFRTLVRREPDPTGFNFWYAKFVEAEASGNALAVLATNNVLVEGLQIEAAGLPPLGPNDSNIDMVALKAAMSAAIIAELGFLKPGN